MSAIPNLKIHYKINRHTLTVDNTPAGPKKVSHLSDLGSIVPTEEESKTAPFRCLDFLKELYKLTKEVSYPGKVSLTELLNKFRVNQYVTKIMFIHGMIISTGGGRTRSYKWNTVLPNIHMATKLLEDAAIEAQPKKHVELVNVKTDVDRAPEERSITLLQPEINYDKIINALKAAMPTFDPTPILEHVNETVRGHFVAHAKNTSLMLEQMLPGIVRTELKYLAETYPEHFKPDVQILEVEKIVREHHHHYKPLEPKTNFFNKLFKLNTNIQS